MQQCTNLSRQHQQQVINTSLFFASTPEISPVWPILDRGAYAPDPPEGCIRVGLCAFGALEVDEVEQSQEEATMVQSPCACSSFTPCLMGLISSFLP